MLTVFGLLIASFLIAFAIYVANNRDLCITIVWLLISIGVSLSIMCITLANSYGTYFDIKKIEVNIENYSGAIKHYTYLAVINKDFKDTSSEITDLKYQNYQTSMKDLIRDLRTVCIQYNKILVGKRIYGNNILFNWLIIMPDDDMKTISISKLLEDLKIE